ncbi:MAG TPA: PIN domain-containing protein [Kofleriaceae bacterium]|jgi:predicted nucleic acid-binding protein
MTQRSFFDTNIFVYADDAGAGVKRARAQVLIDSHAQMKTLVLSTQVMQEYFDVATRKLRLPAEFARFRVENMARHDVVLNDGSIVLGAIDLHRLHRISIWDALLVKAASSGNCGVLFSEDLNHGQTIDGVRIENPFLPAGTAAEPRARYQPMPELQYVPAPPRTSEPKARKASANKRDKRPVAR